MKKLTYEFVKGKFEKEGYELLSREYVDAHTKLSYRCPNGHAHSITWNDWKNGCRCAVCFGAKIVTIDDVRDSFEFEEYKLLSKYYVNNNQKLEYLCPNGHKHSIAWHNWNGSNKRRCPYCDGQGKPDFDYIRKSFEKEGYTLLTNDYKNARSYLEYMCNNGHKHHVVWYAWQVGCRCPECAIGLRSGNVHWNWKGGITPLVMRIRNYIGQCGWSKKVFEKDHYVCKMCGNVGGRLHAHHIVRFSNIMTIYKIDSMKKAKQCELLLDVNNGITLCTGCHKKVHSANRLKEV